MRIHLDLILFECIALIFLNNHKDLSRQDPNLLASTAFIFYSNGREFKTTQTHSN